MTGPGLRTLSHELRTDPLTGARVIVTPWRQQRPNLPEGPCPFCPGGLEAPDGYEVLAIPNRWPGLPDGRHEVVLHSPDHISSFPSLGVGGAAAVVELWSARTAALGSRADVSYVFIFENRGRVIGATIDHPHSQILAFDAIPPVAQAELAGQVCELCAGQDAQLEVARHSGWQAAVPWAPSWPYEMVLSAHDHVADLPAAGQPLRTGLAGMLVASASGAGTSRARNNQAPRFRRARRGRLLRPGRPAGGGRADQRRYPGGAGQAGTTRARRRLTALAAARAGAG